MWPHELKLLRASQHFEKLKAKVWAWEEGEGYALWIEEDGHAGWYVARAEVHTPVTEDPFSLLVGDVLQNARAALDYLATALGDEGAGGAMSPEDAAATQFPLVGGRDPFRPSDGRPRFDELASRFLPTVTDPVRAIIERLQPYNSGRDQWAWESLWLLHELARFDRHRFLQLGVVRAGGFMLDPNRSSNVNITDLIVDEGSFEILEADTLQDAEMRRATGLPPEYGAQLARFCAEPINPDEEMDMHFEGVLEIVFDPDRLPESVRMLGESIVMDLWDTVPAVQRVFDELSPYLPDEPPRW